MWGVKNKTDGQEANHVSTLKEYNQRKTSLTSYVGSSETLTVQILKRYKTCIKYESPKHETINQLQTKTNLTALPSDMQKW